MAIDFCPFCGERTRRGFCRECDAEEFLEEVVPGVDVMMREVPTRFGESVSTDDAEPNPPFSPDRFADSIEDSEEEDDDA